MDEKTEPVLKEMLAAKGIEIKGVLPHSPAIARANLLGGPLDAGALQEEVDRLMGGIRGELGRH
ncbi:MAG: hypothetical protein H5U01_10735 [Clostridia bacterium]|nr:hypothetical protein [Clostridia bacterium]